MKPMYHTSRNLSKHPCTVMCASYHVMVLSSICSIKGADCSEYVHKRKRQVLELSVEAEHRRRKRNKGEVWWR